MAEGSISLIQKLRIDEENPNEKGILKTIEFEYFDSDIAGVPSEEGLSLYFSNDGGEMWRKLDGTLEMNANQFVIDGSETIEIIKGQNNLLTLAAAECSNGNKPSNEVTVIVAGNSTTHGINHDQTTTNPIEVNVCLGDTFELISNATNGDFFRWTKTTDDPMVGTVLLKEGTVAINPEDITNAFISGMEANEMDHEGTYSLYVRNSKGCESQRDIIVKVRPIPEAKFEITPQSDNTNIVCLAQTITFDATMTEDHGDSISSYQWMFERTVNEAGNVISSPTIISTGADYYLQLFQP